MSTRILRANMVTHSLHPLHRHPPSYVHISRYQQLIHTPIDTRAICRGEEVKDPSLYLTTDQTILVDGVIDIGERAAEERVFEEEYCAGLVGEARAEGCREMDCCGGG